MNRIEISQVGQGRIITELAQQYGPMDALREYITNGVDALYESNKGRGNIKVTVDPDSYRLFVGDDARGMNKEKLESLPVSVGASEKFDKVDLRGEKAIGLLAFGSLGNRMYLFSRDHTSVGYDYVMYEIKDSDPRWDPGCYTESQMSSIGGPFEHGTRVVLNVKRQTFNDKFKSKDVKSEIQQIYWPLIDKGDIKFLLQRGNEKPSRIVSTRVRGENIYDDTLEFTTTKSNGDTLEHRVAVKLWLDVKTDAGKIPLYSKGVRVHKDITGIDSDPITNGQLWNCKKVKGYIDEENLTLTLGRDKINEERSSNAFAGFVQALSELDEELWPDVESKIARITSQKNKQLLDNVYNELINTYETQGLRPLNTKPRKEHTGERIRWKVEEDNGNSDDTTDTDGTQNGDEPTSDGEKKPRRIKNPFGNLESISFEIDERDYRSRIGTGLGGIPSIQVNNLHPDYKRFVDDNKPDSPEARAYLTEVIATQMAWWESGQVIKDGRTYSSPDERFAEVTRRAGDLVFSTISKG